MVTPDPAAYARALDRIQELSGAIEDSPEKQELIALTEAVEKFEEALKALVDQLGERK